MCSVRPQHFWLQETRPNQQTHWSAPGGTYVAGPTLNAVNRWTCFLPNPLQVCCPKPPPCLLHFSRISKPRTRLVNRKPWGRRGRWRRLAGREEGAWPGRDKGQARSSGGAAGTLTAQGFYVPVNETPGSQQLLQHTGISPSVVSGSLANCSALWLRDDEIVRASRGDVEKPVSLQHRSNLTRHLPAKA